MCRKSKLGLPSGAGGACGIAHIGVLKVLQRESIPIDLIVETRIGALALVGAAYAINPGAFALEMQVFEVLKSRAKEKTGLKLLERSYWAVDFKPDFFHRFVRTVQKEIFLNLALFRSAVLTEYDLRASVEASFSEHGAPMDAQNYRQTNKETQAAMRRSFGATVR